MELHPETKHGAASPSKDCKLQSFVAATSEAIGKDKSTISRAAARGEALGPDLDAVTGTSLDKGVELDALAKMAKEDRAPPWNALSKALPSSHDDKGRRVEQANTALMLFDEATQGKAGNARIDEQPRGEDGRVKAKDRTVNNVNNTDDRPQGNSAAAGLRRLHAAATPIIDQETGEVTPSGSAHRR